ncbi:MAG: helix-turn-helix domain-containing protein [Gloeocapsa sp. DLM2.Bin57]|nr:MAG: helix-turn-helix domain-containing protein [Gloeocapsa sp. DLM2.Bin57]
MFNNTHRIKIDVFRWEHPGIRRYSNLVKVLGEFRTWINNAISITPVRAELTTHQAAELLNVSRPYLIKLLEQGHIPYRKVGSHRRIPTQPLLEYKAKEEEKANCALDEIVSLTEKLGLYD